MLNVDGWTDGRTNGRTYERTNGRKLARLCLPAKAGATKNEKAHIFSTKNVAVFQIFKRTLTYDVVSFEQSGPGIYGHVQDNYLGQFEQYQGIPYIHIFKKPKKYFCTAKLYRSNMPKVPSVVYSLRLK